MKIALYIEDSLEQIVLTPEGETETSILDKLTDIGRVFSIRQGSFYHCQGGWIRQGSDTNSTILVLEKKSSPTVEREGEKE